MLTSECSVCRRVCEMHDHSRPIDRVEFVCKGGATAWRERPHFHAEKCVCGHMWIEYNDTPHMTNTERRALDAARAARQSGEA